jgi:DNA-binding transcriptional LysR family regulator
MQNRRFIDRAFAEIGATPTIVMEANGFTATLAQVASGSSATIAPQGVADTFFAEKTVQLKLVDPVVTHAIGLAIREQTPVPPAIHALRAAVKASL